MKPEDSETLIELLAHRAEASPERLAFTFNGVGPTFAELWQEVNRFATLLQTRGIARHERVLIALPNSIEFFYAFYGVQRAGGIAVPIFPGSGNERILALAAACHANNIVVSSSLASGELQVLSAAFAPRSLSVVTVSQAEKIPIQTPFPSIHAEDVAFLQYTSGSTGNPKGVILTHANLITNIRQMITGMEITDRDVFVSWLPVYHDMGLILKTMVPFYLATETHLLPTDLRSVRPWLNTIQTRRATFTAAPDIAYRLCLRHVDPDEFDLSSLRVALNAAEPVRAETIQQFEKAFRLRNVMAAGYGLAEATVGVSMSKPGTAARVDAHGRVSVGRPFPNVEVVILNNGGMAKAGEIGEIAIHSPANSSGYFNNPQETSRLFWKDGYILSGDLGCLDEEGYLFVAGRKKNIIKHFGETISPQEIEEIVDAAPNVRLSAAIGVDKNRVEGEQVYVFAEMRKMGGLSKDMLQEMAVQIVQSFHDRMGFRPARVYLLKPHSIPLTYNGKIRYGSLKESYLNNSLREQGNILYPDY